ncbi:DUF5590 domain-containing protein [Bacillus sp. CECT 9360]|uniref:cell wall elongation regulator TseB-like domain-containing protein n=1 Tax=Bacillus sp. CECT 9360 TaxID=2845821 RepID=UPI001E61996E|nr:DUF5590 domain-containing protein [Bacillus sp. CECT 9360]CAH0345514.1 putative protein YpmB [Bacillus sp. CECT 9360]
MKKWLIISAIVVLLIFGIAAGSYITALGPKNDAKREAFQSAKEESGLITMDEFYIYNGLDSYHVVIGDTEAGEKKIVWLPNDNKNEPVTENYKDGIPKQEIQQLAEKKLNPEKIISIKPGLENSTPLWEVTYLDESKRYNYAYYDFKTGEWLKYYRSI